MSGLSYHYWILIAPFLVLLTQCASRPPPAPPKPAPIVTISVTGSADQNPDINGAPSPVAVRIIELTGTGTFESADVFALLDHQQQTLGAEEAGTREFIISPSEHRSVTIDPKPGVTAIGLAALYRDIDNARWRTVAPIAGDGPTNLVAGIGKLAVTLTASP